MATIQQVQKGFTVFVDREVAGAFEGWQRIVVAGCAGLIAGNIPKIIEEYGKHPIVAALGVYKPENGTVDIDALYNAFVPKMNGEKIPITIPKIGTVKMGREEIDALMRYIREA